MTEHLREVRELAALKFGIINLIEELDKYKDLKGIQDYLKDLIECCYDNTNDKEYRKKVCAFYRNLKENDDNEQ